MLITWFDSAISRKATLTHINTPVFANAGHGYRHTNMTWAIEKETDTNQYIKVEQAQVNCERCLSAYNMFLSVYYFSSAPLGMVIPVLDHWIAIKFGADVHYSQRMTFFWLLWFLFPLGQGRFWGGGATGASAPITLSLDPPVAPLTGSLH